MLGQLPQQQQQESPSLSSNALADGVAAHTSDTSDLIQQQQHAHYNASPTANTRPLDRRTLSLLSYPRSFLFTTLRTCLSLRTGLSPWLCACPTVFLLLLLLLCQPATMTGFFPWLPYPGFFSLTHAGPSWVKIVIHHWPLALTVILTDSHCLINTFCGAPCVL